MTTYVQGGVWVRLNNQTETNRLKYKKDLKEYILHSPQVVWFYPTSGMGPQFSGFITELDYSTTLVIVGPDPYNKRTWYANINRTEKGLLKIT